MALSMMALMFYMDDATTCDTGDESRDDGIADGIDDAIRC